jgi:hypothetical protein
MPPAHAPPTRSATGRATWLAAVVAVFVSTCLPWSGGGSPVDYAAAWSARGQGGETLLGVSLLAPMFVLVAVLLLEARTSPYPAAAGLVIALAALSLASLSVVGFSDLLPERPPNPAAIFVLSLPRPINAWSGWTRLLVRAVVFLPPIAWAVWVGVARSRALSPLAARFTVSHWWAAQVMLWFQYSDGFGAWVGAGASAALLATGAVVDDAPPVASRKCRRALTVATLGLLVCMAVLALLGRLAVADSQAGRAGANVASLENLETNLALHGYSIDTVPVVLQYNKRDLPEILSVAALDAMLNPAGRERFEGMGLTGVGVFDTLKAVARQVLTRAKRG